MSLVESNQPASAQMLKGCKQSERRADRRMDNAPSTSASRSASATSVVTLAMLDLTVAHGLARALGRNEQAGSNVDDSGGGGVGVDGADGPERWCIIA